MNAPEVSFGRYELRGTLGRGGFATVYRAWDPALGREVRERFVAEARAIAQLDHPNIVTVYDVGEAAGRPFFAMQLVAGPTLAELIAADGPVELARAIAILQSLCSAVEYLHAAGIVHRDIKAANVMLDPAGRAVLMDFGIARLLEGAHFTRTGLGIGTPEAMPPEQVRGDAIGPAADIYALGILAFQLLSGRPPFVGNTAYVLYAQVHEPPPPLEQFRPGLPGPVYRAVAAALAKEPQDRPASAGALAMLLVASDELVSSVVVVDARPSRRSDPVSQREFIGVFARRESVRPAPVTAHPTRRAVQFVLIFLALTAAFTATVVTAYEALGGSKKSVVPATPPAPAGSIVSPTASRPAATRSSTPTLQIPSTQGQISPLSATNFQLRDAAGWGAGATTLQACATITGATDTSAVHLHVASTDPNTTIPDGDPAPIANEAATCAVLSPAGAMPANNYRATLLDEQGKQLFSSNFTISAQSMPAPVAADPVIVPAPAVVVVPSGAPPIRSAPTAPQTNANPGGAPKPRPVAPPRFPSGPEPARPVSGPGVP